MTNNDDDENCERNIKIFVRILPLEKPCELCARIDTKRKKIYIRCLQEFQQRISPKDPSYWCFRTDGIFYDTLQEEIYNVSAKSLVRKVLEGVNCVLISHGQVGSGKSFTIGGLTNNWEHRGLITRLLSDMFTEKTRRKKVSTIRYELSFVELRGTEITDLLNNKAEGKIKVNDRNALKDISMINVNSEEECLRRIFEGETKRIIVQGSTYPASHLATSVITFYVSNASLIKSGGVVSKAKLHVVEMAGTDKVGKNNPCKRISDIGMANLTKVQVEQYFLHLGDSGTSNNFVIRSSSLLKVLGNAFSVTSVIHFISHIRVTKEDLDVTLSTLRFGEKIARLKPVKTRKNMEPQSELAVMNLQNEVRQLKRELFLNDIFLHQESSINISKSRAEQINRSIFHFLNNKITDLTLFSVSQAQVLLKSIKDLHNKLTAKEMDVQNLKEVYENIAKNINQRNISGGSSKETVVTIGGFFNNWKETKSSSQILHDTLREEIGTMSKSKIDGTLEPDVKDPVIHEIARIDKRSKRDIVVNNKDISMASMLQKLFVEFLKDEKQYIEMYDELKKIDENLSTVRERFRNVTDQYVQLKRNLENACSELTKHQQIRRFVETDEHDERNTGIPEEEQSRIRDIACYETRLLTIEIETAHAQKEIQELLERRYSMRAKLESAFRTYCKRDHSLTSLDGDLLKLIFDTQKRESIDFIQQKFNQLQRTMTRKIQKKQRPKTVQ